MAKQAKVNTYLKHVMVRVEGATDATLHAIALQIEGTAKRNIVANNQIDTGFMANSVYVETQQGSTFGQTWQDGSYKGKKGGMKEVEKAPRLQLPNLFSASAVVVGASYAIYQEMKKSFLRTAGQEVAGQVKGIAEPVYGRKMRD